MIGKCNNQEIVWKELSDNRKTELLFELGYKGKDIPADLDNVPEGIKQRAIKNYKQRNTMVVMK